MKLLGEASNLGHWLNATFETMKLDSIRVIDLNDGVHRRLASVTDL
jgi:hypothetical protein